MSDIAEDAVLGIVLNHPGEAARVFAAVPVEAFTGPRTLVAQAIHGLRVRQERADMVSVSIEMQKRGTLGRAGGGDVVAKLAAGYNILAALPAYLDEIVRDLRLRQLEQITTQALALTGANGVDPVELAQMTQTQLQSIIDAAEAEADITTQTLNEFLAVEESDYDWVIPGLLERSDRLILTGGEGLGKALAIDTPIPTPKGWVAMGDLTVGSEVFGPDGQITTVAATTVVMHDRPCYRVGFSDGSSIVADEQHQWLTQDVVTREHRRAGAVVTTRHIASTLRVRQNKVVNHAIPTAAPLQYPAQELPLDPYLIGAWLGDGHSAAARLTCDTADVEIIDNIRATGVPIHKTAGTYGWTMSDGDKRQAKGGTVQGRLRTLGLLGNKHIPDAYLYASVEQRLALLQGLMDTDGTIGLHAQAPICEFSVCSERLARDVLTLMLGLGIKVKMASGPAKIDGRTVGTRYRLAFQTDLSVFRLARKRDRLKPLRTARAKLRYITSVEPIDCVPVRCIQVDRADGMFVAGESCIPTHNSTLFRQIAVCVAGGIHPFTHASIPQQRALYVDCENGPTHMRRKLRPLALQAQLQGQGAGETLFVEGRPEGLNLMDPAQAQWLVHRVAALQPAVLFTGSLYKLLEGDPNKEEPARAVAAVLDRCRAVANCAIVIEAHSGHGHDGTGERQVRPIGASLWRRWPEFGYGLRPVGEYDAGVRLMDFVPWRGDRDERNWPKQLRAGSVWPWEDVPQVNRWQAAS